MRVASYWPLLLLLSIPLLWWLQSRSRTDLTRGHRRVATAVRSASIVFLVGALLEPVWTRSGNWLSVVYLVDVSESVAPEAIADRIEWIGAAQRDGSPDHSRFIAFGRDALVLDSVDALRKVRVGPVPAPGSVDQSGTDLEAALDLASRSFAPGHLKRMVLFTDGNENVGAIRSIIGSLSREEIPVFTATMDVRAGPDAWIEDVWVPHTASADELFPVEVHVYSQSAASATLSIRDDTGEIDQTRTIDLEAGINRIAFEAETTRTGPIVLETTLEAPWDRLPGNDVYRQSLPIAGPPRVLYAEGHLESADYLRDALEQEGIEVEVVGPSGIPEGIEVLSQYDALVLSDVRADAMTNDQMAAIATWVGDLGGGLILAGGESVFGEDGYSGTRIEEILPVRFDIEREPPTVALIIVLDKSGSMGGQKLDLVKEASKAAVDVLKDDQLIGLVAFDYSHYWPFRLQPAENRESIFESISRIVAGGETNIYPALEEAHDELLAADTEIKHVILLSDGRSLPDDFRTLVEAMVQAGETVSSVAVGNGADRELLADIAEWGHGRSYFIEDATRVPQVFTEETELATQGTLREEPFRPVLVKEVEALQGIDFTQAPPLLGYVATIARDTSEILLNSDETEDAQPILARWQYGLGKTVAFTSDVKDRWAVDWLAWEGYARLWPQLLRETIRSREGKGLDLDIRREGDSAVVRLSTLTPQGGFRNDAAPEIRVVTPALETLVLTAEQDGPGSWRARFDLEANGSYVVHATDGDRQAARTLPWSYPLEYHLYPPDTDLLRGISAETGGRFEPEVGEIFATRDATSRRTWALWPWLAGAALLLYLVDLLGRRVRLFENAG